LINFSGETILAIPGATKIQHAQESAGAMDFKLDEGDMHTLDELSREFK
jgi:diketogulonate reductase-like aldo/keto reductase